MVRTNKQGIFVLILANVIAVTSITAQAASLQEEMQITFSPVAKAVSSTYISDVMVEEAKEAEKIIEKKRLQEYEEELLASIIFCEAGNQSYVGQVAVGAVVLNRIHSSKFPDTMEEVIYQSGQFLPAMSGWLDKVRAESGYTESALLAAQDAMKGVNPVGDCLFFDQGGHGYQIGAHYFH